MVLFTVLCCSVLAPSLYAAPIDSVSVTVTIASAPIPALGADPFDMEGIIFASWWHDEYASSLAQASLERLASTGADYVGVLAT